MSSMEPSFASKHDVVVGDPLLLLTYVRVPCALPAHPRVPATRRATSAASEANARRWSEKPVPATFYGQGRMEWPNGRRTACGASGGGWFLYAVGKGRQAGWRAGGGGGGEECPFGV